MKRLETKKSSRFLVQKNRRKIIVSKLNEIKTKCNAVVERQTYDEDQKNHEELVHSLVVHLFAERSADRRTDDAKNHHEDHQCPADVRNACNTCGDEGQAL